MLLEPFHFTHTSKMLDISILPCRSHWQQEIWCGTVRNTGEATLLSAGSLHHQILLKTRRPACCCESRDCRREESPQSAPLSNGAAMLIELISTFFFFYLFQTWTEAALQWIIIIAHFCVLYLLHWATNPNGFTFIWQSMTIQTKYRHCF